VSGRLYGKVAIVSGGARGIGGAAARRFVAEGGRVVIADILRPSRLLVSTSVASST
jgi:3alpha(or 20beta)-hydroxysteroid dehydrogenase